MFRDIILGLTQGITEFLPVSSSAHLVLVSKVFGLDSPGLFEVVAYHLGTLIAVVVLMRKRILDFLLQRSHYLLLAGLVLTTIVTAVVGLTIKKWVSESFESVTVISIALLITSLILYLSNRYFLQKPTKSQPFTLKKAAFIGLIQGIAAFPGISRSGSTLAASFWCRIDRKLAVEYSFLASIPVIGGAFLMEIIDHHLYDPVQLIQGLKPYWLGMLLSCISGFVALKWLLQFLVTKSLLPFSIYCALIGSISLLSTLFG